MYTKRKKNFTVTITEGDRAAVKDVCPKAPLSVVDRRAVARAAAREVLIEAKSTTEALDCLIAEVPRQTLERWMKRHLNLTH